MFKKGLDTGVIHFLIAILFAFGAISKVISIDSIVIAMQWFCTFVFAILGFLRLRRNAIG